ncbi:MAG: hypothetical protein KDD70_07780 [Bdellovibrionales bacterium]|nr:hypothetical protein [Bdellovibrionales bacterium]
MRKLRILIIVHRDLIPPSDESYATSDKTPAWKTEFDVFSGLRELGHVPQFVGLYDDLSVLRNALEEFQPHVCFNLLEEFNEVALYDQNIVGYLELMKHPYTGCNPRGLMLSHDKILTKKILSFHRIPTAKFAFSPRGKSPKPPSYLSYPVVVKSATEHASRGIALASVVNTPEKCRERVQFVHDSIGTDALIEEYVDGRELYVSVIGNDRLTVFPTWELKLGGLPEGTPKIATEKVKFDAEYQKKYGTMPERAKDIPNPLLRSIESAVKRAYRRLYLTGYARFDVRLQDDGQFYLLEANANPSVGYGDEFCEAAEAGGVPYKKLLQRILSLGLSYQALWKQASE